MPKYENITCPTCGTVFYPKRPSHKFCRKACKWSPALVRAEFMTHVRVLENGCWEWQGEVVPRGYGRFCFASIREMAHRYSYRTFKGEIPAEMTVDHECHNRALATCAGGCSCRHRRCVNPDHLCLETQTDNKRKGHGPWKGIANARAKRLSKTTCPHGHQFTELNTLIRKSDGARRCLECERLSCLRRRGKPEAPRSRKTSRSG